MIRRFLDRVFSRRTKPKVIPFERHGISRDSLSPCARRTTDALQKAGYQAYVVGGAVRDLLLGKTPKDFDVATSATPEQVRDVIRRSRIIGRRFRLVHALCGSEIVEVATFRGSQDDAGGDDRRADEHGRLLRDNVWGNMEDDARRRDFTVNALFYDAATQEVWDYHDGVADLKAKRLRIIGDPAGRYREDPVRMLRAVRFASMHGLEIERKTKAPIKELSDLLANVPPARLFDEMLKLLHSGHAVACVKKLRSEGLHHGLLPLLDVILDQPLGERFVMAALRNTDERIRADKGVAPSFLFAALLWHEVLATSKKLEGSGMPAMSALFQAMDDVLAVQAGKLAIPRRLNADMKDIWSLQLRMLSTTGKRTLGVLTHPRFRAAYDFLLLRCESGEIEASIGAWWTRFQDVDHDEREDMLRQQPRPPGGGEARRRRRPRRRSGPGEGAPQAGGAGGE